MDIQLILGPNDSGKSLFAEALAVQKGNPRIYIATMIPQNEDNLKRIKKHQLQRQDKGFITIEAGWNVHELCVPGDSVILFEDVSNFLANGLFEHQAKPSEALEQLLHLADQCQTLIIVSIDGLTDTGYDAETGNYIRSLNWLNQKLSQKASHVFRPPFTT